MWTIHDVPPESDVAGDVWREPFGLREAGPNVASNDTAGARHDADEYQPQLGTRQLIARVRMLLATERRAERLICRYLADLADRVRQRRDPALGAYADELHAARCFFGLGVRDTRERVRIGRALRGLPHIERAFIEGELSFSRVREVTRVATARTEHEWLELAQRLDMRSLERRVAMAGESSVEGDSRDGAAGRDAADGRGGSDARPGEGNRRLDAPVRAEWSSPKALRVTFLLASDAWALLERAIEGARRASQSSLSDGEALEAVARDALLAQTRDIEASDPRRAVVLYECQRCQHTELDTGAGTLELDPPCAAALGCGATVYDLSTEGRGVSRGGPLPAAVRRAVMLRDHCRCRVPGCNRRRYVDVHHLIDQAHGGEHSRRNCLVLCTTHHRLLHEGKLSIEGDADQELSFHDATGEEVGLSNEPLRSRHEQVGSTDCVAASRVSSPEATGHRAPQRGSSSDVDGPNFEGKPDLTPDGQSDSASECSSSVDRAEVTHLASFGLPVEPATRLLQIMGRRGGWSADALIDASGLSASQVAVALTLLELAGRVRWRDFTLEPI